jgi:hypothetical protein
MNELRDVSPSRPTSASRALAWRWVVLLPLTAIVAQPVRPASAAELQGAPPAAPQESSLDPSGSPGFAVALLEAELPPLPPNAPKPPADPRNLEGTWFHDQLLETRILTDMYRNPLPLSATGQRVRADRVSATYVKKLPYANASAECIPPGQPWQIDLNFPFQIFQSKNEVTFVFQEYHGIWNIRLNQPHRRTGPLEYMGDSVGHWDGNTLVVDTTGYKRALWLDVDGTPASRKAHMVFRIRRIDYGTPKLEIVETLEDPTMYTAPWSMVRTFRWRPDMTNFVEYNCEYQVGTKEGVSRYGLSPEPLENTQ